MATTQKAIELCLALQDEFKIRLSALALSFAYDTDGNPYLSIGSGTAGQKNAIVKVLPYSWPNAKDVLGNSAIQYGPHTIQLATELSASAGPGTIWDVQNFMHLIGPIMAKGTHFDWYQSANGVAPTTSTFGTASNLKGSFELSLQYPLIQLQ